MIQIHILLPLHNILVFRRFSKGNIDGMAILITGKHRRAGKQETHLRQNFASFDSNAHLFKKCRWQL